MKLLAARVKRRVLLRASLPGETEQSVDITWEDVRHKSQPSGHPISHKHDTPSFCGWIHPTGLPVSVVHLYAMISVALAPLSRRILMPAAAAFHSHEGVLPEHSSAVWTH